MKSDCLHGSSPPRRTSDGRRAAIGCALPAAILFWLNEHRAAFHVYTILIAAARARAVPSEFFQIGLKR